MGPVGAIIGSLVFTVILGATGNDVITGGFVAGVVPYSFGGLLIMGVARLSQGLLWRISPLRESEENADLDAISAK